VLGNFYFKTMACSFYLRSGNSKVVKKELFLLI